MKQIIAKLERFFSVGPQHYENYVMEKEFSIARRKGVESLKEPVLFFPWGKF